RSRRAAALVALQRLDRRRRGDGRPPSRVAGRRCAVPSRVDPHAGRPGAARAIRRSAATCGSGRGRRGRVTPEAAIARVAGGDGLSETEMAALMERVLDGAVTPAQLGALLMGLRLKGETVDELTGAARALRRRATAIPSVPPGTVDTCGTGGDGGRTVNVSTAAALVVAACGVPVAKHGNRAVSSSVGSADVLEALGVVVELPAASLAACLDTVGFAFLLAPALQPAMRHAAAPRRELGVRTLFNLLGPLASPAGVT